MAVRARVRGRASFYHPSLHRNHLGCAATRSALPLALALTLTLGLSFVEAQGLAFG